MSNVPEIVVNDVTNKYNVEILRNHKTGLLPWETRIGRLKRRFTRVEDAVKRAVRKGVQDLVVVAAVSYRLKKRQ
jgi:alpha-D-ribose 1-methylphosphonate 5-triphosphate synthase subunit PhnG